MTHCQDHDIPTASINKLWLHIFTFFFNSIVLMNNGFLTTFSFPHLSLFVCIKKDFRDYVFSISFYPPTVFKMIPLRFSSHSDLPSVLHLMGNASRQKRAKTPPGLTITGLCCGSSCFCCSAFPPRPLWMI